MVDVNQRCKGRKIFCMHKDVEKTHLPKLPYSTHKSPTIPLKTQVNAHCH